MGIILGSAPVLCKERPTTEINAPDAKTALEQAVTDTGYKVSTEDGVFVVIAPDIGGHESSLLHFRFDRFAGTNVTIGEAGAHLSGYIKTVAEGDSGFATDWLVGASAETFTLRLESATTQEIANRIALLGQKGLWVFRPTEEHPKNGRREDPIVAFGYRDDAAALDRFDCRRFLEGPQ